MKRSYAVLGLGYVGLELAVALARKTEVLGYDLSESRISQLKNNLDFNHIIRPESLKSSPITFTNDIQDLKNANFFFIAVQTPVYHHETPDLSHLKKATESLAGILKKNDIVVYESTVYPGVTETICVNILENVSGLQCGKDFNIGYSPERINPTDQVHTLYTMTKIISAQNNVVLAEMRKVYKKICNEVFPVSSIKVAESVKLLENTQRDVNIACINEFAIIMNKLDIDTAEVLEGAKTKWNFIDHKPGLVGGHCIPVDPLYLAYRAKTVGVKPELILKARQVNDSMPAFILQEMFKLLIKKKINFKTLRIAILGISYKENISDIRNSLALAMVQEIRHYGFHCLVNDPYVHQEKLTPYQIELTEYNDLKKLDVIIIAVGHQYYLEKGLHEMEKRLKGAKLIMDIPHFFKHMKTKRSTIWTI